MESIAFKIQSANQKGSRPFPQSLYRFIQPCLSVPSRERIHSARRWHTRIGSVAGITSLPKRRRHRPPLLSILGKVGAHDVNDGTLLPLRTYGSWASTFRSPQNQLDPLTPVSPPMPLHTSGNVEVRLLLKRL